MKMSFSLITGTLVIDTEDVEVATETMSPKADFAGIIADKFGEVPHILFFSIVSGRNTIYSMFRIII